MAEGIDFKKLQYQIAAHIRDPEHNPAAADIEDRRMAIYRRLFFNNIDNFLSNAFPVLKQLHNAQQWQQLVRDFMSQHYCQSPLFHQISAEFVGYLQVLPETALRWPFMAELAHYEWLELALSVAECSFHSDAGLTEPMQQPLQLSGLAHLQLYRYPVQQISAQYQPEQPSETPICLLLYRDAEDKVRFIELNPVSARLLDLLDQGNNGQSAAKQIADELQHPQSAVVVQSATELITDWLARGILIKAG